MPADHTFSSVATIDLGDRAVELVHPGRGHTGGDLVVRIDDADVVLAGDLVEESGAPAYGDDCFPLDWPRSLDLALELIGQATVVVPGHGAPVDRDFVQEQRASIDVVAERSATWPAAECRSTRRSSRRSGPTRARTSVTPYAVATSSCRARRSASRSSEL